MKKDNMSLAQFISEQRENRGFSALGFAKAVAVPLSDIEDIESGKVLFLPVTLRQKLAKALKIAPSEIKAYEKTINVMHTELCPRCKGRKFINGNKCNVCNGLGEYSQHKKINVKIPAKVKHGTKKRG